MDHAELRSRIRWHREYRPAWDETPDEYASHGVVSWGKSRRLGKLSVGQVKAYLGVQHVDPSLPGWASVAETPQARFFVSIFVGGRSVSLRTAPTMDAALDLLRAGLP